MFAFEIYKMLIYYYKNKTSKVLSSGKV